jgi:flagellar biosynthesis/type III secretory pathway protein FliH
MLTAEFKLEEAQQVWLEEGIEKGIEKGRKKGIEEGIEKGIKKGIKKGIEKGKVDMVRSLLADGFPLDAIARSAGMPLEKIQALVS